MTSAVAFECYNTVRHSRPWQLADGSGLIPTVPAGRNLEADPITLGQRSETVHLDRAVMHEDVGARFSRDEPVTLLGVEPFHRALGHVILLGPSSLGVARHGGSG